MQRDANKPFLQSDVSIVLGGVRVALAKFPRIRNPVSRARIFGRNVVAKSRPSDAFESPKQKSKRIRRELIDAGVSVYGLLKSESRYLPKVMHDDEHIEAAVYGQHNSSSAMLVATDERIIYLDKKPMAEFFDEVSYEVVSGIEFDIHLFFAAVVLHTPVRNYDFKFVNMHCAEKFARLIEAQRLERDHKENGSIGEFQPSANEAPRSSEERPNEFEENLAGYYWLPTEEEELLKLQNMG